MIVKNEEEVLARCLDSAIEAVDEIIIVDTGSTDNTKNIAYRYTDKVYDFKWKDDFSLARNFSFSKATGDYLIWLDADDYIPRRTRNRIKEIKENPLADVYMLRYDVAFDSTGEATFSFYRERILRRSLDFSWQGFVHEVIEPRGKVVYVDEPIEHRKTVVKNSRRNLDIYLKHKKKGYSFSPRDRYYYARELYYQGEDKSCGKEIRRLLREDETPIYVHGASILLSEIYLARDQSKEAHLTLMHALRVCGGDGELCSRIGEIYYKRRDFESAIFWYKCALICPSNIKKGIFSKKEYEALFPCLRLTEILYATGKVDEARKYHEIAKQHAPCDQSVIYNDQFFDRQ